MKALKMVSTVMAVSLLTVACSSKEEASPSATPSASSGTSTSTAKPTKEKLNLKWFIGSNGIANSTLPSADKDFVKKAIEEKFNVSLTLDYMVFGSDYTNKMNLILSGGDVPDMFIAQGTDSQKYAVDGLLADLTPYVSPQTMPNYYKWVTQEEINNYQLKGIKFSRAPMPFQRNTYASFYIRKDWLDKLGLKLPKTYDELMNAMRDFTNKDPDGNGKKDTYGISAASGGNRIPFDFPQWIQNGLIADFRIDGDTFMDNQTDPKLQNVIQGIVDMMKEGIVDPDWYVNKSPMHLDKAAQGKIGVMWSGDMSFAFDSVPTSVQSKTKQLDPKADWQPIFPFDSPYGWKAGTPGGQNPFVFAKSVADKNPEKVKRSIEILDWLTSEEGYLMTHYGLEGKHYKREGNKITIDPDAIDKDIVKNGDWLNIYRFFTAFDEPSVLKLEVIDPRLSDRDRAIMKFVEAIPKSKGEPVTLAPPEGTNIGDFRKEMARLEIKAIFEDKTGANWPKYREELMTKYNGNKIFQGYVDQINAVLPADKKLKPWK
ncbi:extracellular solute-binding protein [Paenibacillus sp. HJGM_3]|uniref:extracellular solute-binding protein n=1 Tax=Paenibacillus sp. HJGM_3 TaxID=3379816 RepID=UPI00385D665B